jgi:hypothetical protein
LNHWPFITAAYALTIISTLTVVLWSFGAMRRAEAQADEMRREQ